MNARQPGAARWRWCLLWAFGLVVLAAAPAAAGAALVFEVPAAWRILRPLPRRRSFELGPRNSRWKAPGRPSGGPDGRGYGAGTAAWWLTLGSANRWGA